MMQAFDREVRFAQAKHSRNTAVFELWLSEGRTVESAYANPSTAKKNAFRSVCNGLKTYAYSACCECRVAICNTTAQTYAIIAYIGKLPSDLDKQERAGYLYITRQMVYVYFVEDITSWLAVGLRVNYEVNEDSVWVSAYFKGRQLMKRTFISRKALEAFNDAPVYFDWLGECYCITFPASCVKQHMTGLKFYKKLSKEYKVKARNITWTGGGGGGGGGGDDDEE